MFKYRNIFFILMIAAMTQSCVRLRSNLPALPTPRPIETVSGEEAADPTSTKPAQLPTATATLTVVPTAALPIVTITAVNGNVNIRRGPSLAYNPISVLYKGMSAKVIAHDVLTKWAQIELPGSDKTGWISLLTDYATVEGDLDSLPGFTTTEWPITAYLINCTHHEMFVMPGGITLPSAYQEPENEIWLNPGHYTVYDLEVPDLTEVKSFDIREGQEIEITEDGAGERRKCR
jgi:uncharacterized protein YgiM (DUF1202 family)